MSGRGTVARRRQLPLAVVCGRETADGQCRSLSSAVVTSFCHSSVSALSFGAGDNFSSHWTDVYIEINTVYLFTITLHAFILPGVFNV